MTVLIVESEPGSCHRVRDQLQDRGMQVTLVERVAEVATLLATRSFLVAILDLVEPDGSALDLLDVLRESGSTAHVIVLGGSTAELHRVEALHRGADDFVVKPFFLQELTARVLAVRRRRTNGRDTGIRLGRWDIDLRSRRVTCGDEVVDLTAREFDLLAYLAARPGSVFSREQLLNSVWRSTSGWQQPATVTEHIRRLRTKLEPDPRRPSILVTVRGAGYRLDLPAGNGPEPEATRPPPEPGVVVHVGGRIVFADEAAVAILGYPGAATLRGMDMLELVDPASHAAAAARLAAGEAGQLRRSEIMQLRRADGEPVMAEVESSRADWHGQRARRVQLTALSDAPARLQRLVTGVLADVADAVIITDLHAHIRSWNAAAERIYGWSEDAVLGRHALDVLQWVGEDGQLADTSAHLERTDRWNGTGLQTTRDGSTVEVLCSTTLLRDEGGEPIAVVSVNRLVEVAGRSRIPELDTTLADRVEQGIEDDEFVVHYQPIVDLDDGHVVALEALVRWEHPERGILAPSDFIEAAERSGLIVELGEVVLDKACRQAAAWRRAGADVLLSVNVSTRQLADPGLAERFIGVLQASGLDPGCLWLEITETALVTELDKASHALRTLVGLGVGVSIDDFGTGWASLTYLQSFPAHALKIDGSFVPGTGHDASDTAIVRSILSLGADLGLFVVAEGIETAAQHEVLKSMGCTLGQGFFYARPAPAAEVPIELAHRLEAGPEVAAGHDRPVLGSARSKAGGMTPAAGLIARARATARFELAAEARSSGSDGARPRTAPAFAAKDELESEVIADVFRGLPQVSSARGAVDLFQATIRRLGGTIVPAAAAGEDAFPIDVSLGEGPPMLVEADRLSIARMQLGRLLPRFVEDAREAVDLLRRTERLQDETSRDDLTGLGDRRDLDHLLELAAGGRLRSAIDLGLGLLADGATFQQVIVDVLAPAQRQVGLRWETNRWSVADEHAATAVIDGVLGALSLEAPRHDPWRGTVVVACAEGEHHTMPARMGVELLRADGWDVTFLGGSVPANDLQRFVVAHQPDVVLISCTVPLALAGARRCFRAIGELGPPAIAVGAAFGADAGRALRLGARGWLGPGTQLATVLEDHLEPEARAWLTPPEALAMELDRASLEESCLSVMAEQIPVMSGYSPARLRSTRTDVGHLLEVLRTAVDLDDDAVFEDFVAWMAGVLGSRDVPPEVLDESLAIIGEVLRATGMVQAATLCLAPRAVAARP